MIYQIKSAHPSGSHWCDVSKTDYDEKQTGAKRVVYNDTEIGFWSTLEITCVVSTFPYSQYREMHERAKLRGAPLSEQAYTQLGKTFYADMEARTDE